MRFLSKPTKAVLPLLKAVAKFPCDTKFESRWTVRGLLATLESKLPTLWVTWYLNVYWQKSLQVVRPSSI